MENIIWDLDGTLLNSYPIIQGSLREMYLHFAIPYDEFVVQGVIMKTSTRDLINKVSLENHLNPIVLKNYFSQILEERNSELELVSGARETLDFLFKNRVKQFLFTHKGNNTKLILTKFGLDGYFTEIITSANNFERKPNPEAINYLLRRYNMDKENTYYIGDRKIDVELALNAGIKSINLIEHDDSNNIKIDNLESVGKIFEGLKG